MNSILTELTESKLYPSRQSLKKENFDNLSETIYLLVLLIRVLLWEEDTGSWAKDYVKKTYRQDYNAWRSDGTDLYIALFALTQGEYGGGGKRHIDVTLLNRWFKAIVNHTTSEDDMRRLFLRMDSLFHVRNSSLKALRRDIMAYPDLSREEQENVVTRLINKARSKTAWYVLVRKLRSIKDEMDDLKENASAGATSSASVATVVGGLGAGFDPNGDQGIYGPKKKKKPIVLRR